jgi:hypothetical protein
MFLSIGLVHGQACGELGVDCGHPSTQQRPSGDDNSGSSGSDNNNDDDGLDASDYAWNHYSKGNDSRNRYEQSGSYLDFVAAQSEFQNALANVNGYGPAELGLCQLFAQAKEYVKAIAACQVALRSDDFAHGRKMKKWIRETLMPWIDLRQRRHQINDEFAQWKRICTWSTSPSSNGSTVDPSANITQFVAECAKWHARLLTQDTQFDKDEKTYKARHPEGAWFPFP